jgi:hypothetical protein
MGDLYIRYKSKLPFQITNKIYIFSSPLVKKKIKTSWIHKNTEGGKNKKPEKHNKLKFKENSLTFLEDWRWGNRGGMELPD